MQIYNTLGRTKQEFEPKDASGNPTKQVLFYHCGPTVYWVQHLGNLRAMVLADLIRRSLMLSGYDVRLVRNYTDVGHLTSDDDLGDDKMAIASEREKLTPADIADKYIKVFEEDAARLNILEPDAKPRATDFVEQDIAMVQTLLDKGFAYQTDLAIYFDVSKAKNYTALSGQNLDELRSSAGKGEISDPDKKSPHDFAIWFFKAGAHEKALQTWPSPFDSKLVTNGEGFPGWHLECSVMCLELLAKTIHIHMGGIEHIPVHHTNEIAQSEAANGQKFAEFWLHNEHLLVDGGKMSKSAGTSYTLQDVVDRGFDPLVVRYFFMQAHYRSKQNFTWEALEASQTAFEKMKKFLSEEQQDKLDSNENSKQKLLDKFKNFISDDFNIPQALALAWEVVKSTELNFSDKKYLLLEFDKVFGLGLAKVKEEKEDIPSKVVELAEKRLTTKQNKDWVQADALRDQIKEQGFEIEDSVDGYKLVKK